MIAIESTMDGGEPVVGELQPGDEARWDEFVLAEPDGTFFHLSGWREIMENALGHRSHFLTCHQDGELTGILPLAQVKSLLFGNALISLPFLVYGGPVTRTKQAQVALVSAAVELAESLGVDHLELRNRQRSDRDWPVGDHYVTFRKALDPDPEKNLLAIPRKQRAMIRKGIKAGLAAEVDTDTARFFPALLECKRNLGTPFFRRQYFDALLDTFGSNIEITTIVRGSQTICSVMSFRFRNEILPYYGGGGDVARGVKGNDFMYWAVMEKACTDGLEIFDYGRSAAGTGAYRFKKHWGFEPEPLGYEFRLINSTELPNLNPSNPKYRHMINAWKKLPLWTANLIGPPLARRLG